jgi:outer membrane protein, heavy metal efflux system
MKNMLFVLALGLAWLAPAASGQTTTTPVQVPTDLTLADAIRLALEANPGLRSLALERRKAEGRTRQAGARPNPELAFDLENFSGTMSGLTESEATLSVGQRLELGGKRGARVDVARADERVVAIDLAAGRQALIADVAARYLEALAAERSLALSDEEVRAAEEAAKTFAQRVAAGAAHPVEQRRADVELSNARLDRIEFEVEASLAETRLSLLWGEAEPRFDRVVGVLDSLPEAPDVDSLARRAETAPALARWSALHESGRRRLELERAQRVPDLTAEAGVRSLEDTDDRTFVGSVSLPLPVFDRNRGSIDEAAAALEQIPSDEARERLEIRRAVGEALATLRREHVRLQSLRRDVLPQSARAFEEMRVGFERGRFTYLDLLEARRTWIRARREELDTLLAGHQAVIQIERLIGGPLTAPREGGSQE